MTIFLVLIPLVDIRHDTHTYTIIDTCTIILFIIGFTALQRSFKYAFRPILKKPLESVPVYTFLL